MKISIALPLFLTFSWTCRAEEASFVNGVMAALSKAGCNMGVCHGNRNGKGGFKLSLRGQDPLEDWRALTAEIFSRRINRVEPEQSLILLKPTAQVPHEGGMRFEIDSLEYDILRRWIAAGASLDSSTAPQLEDLEAAPREKILNEPESQARLQVTATFSGGEKREVTALAVYEPVNAVAAVSSRGLVQRQAFGDTTILVRFLNRQIPVRLSFVPARPEFAWRDIPARNYIDELAFAKLRALRLVPSPLANDLVFMRRVFLDAIGLLPSAGEARSFAGDPSPDKRARLIDRLLERPEFADFWALKWSDLLKNEEKALDRKGVANFHQWIRQSILDGKPLDQFARELIAARGSTYENPPANFYRANRDPMIRAEAAAQVFLGTRLQCARCHNHPFERWTQDDYYSWAGFFARVQYKLRDNQRLDNLDQHEFIGEQIVYMATEGEVTHPRTGAGTAPRFLGAAGPELAPGEDRLEKLAGWVADPANPLFARVQANRIWFHLLGRGLVEPIDDFRATNPPSNPQLLEALAKDLTDHGFDLRHLARTILNSRLYQLAAEPNDTNQDDETHFSRALVRRQPAEQLLDAMGQALGAAVTFSGHPAGRRAGQLPGVEAVRTRDRPASAGDKFLRLFGKPQRFLSCECERSSETTLIQTFQMISGPVVHRLLADPRNRLERLLDSGQASGAIVEELYWSALSRPPAESELKALAGHLDSAADRRAALEDIAWSLLNAKEFVLRR